MNKLNFLLVDLLPYEIPLLFSNQKLTNHIIPVISTEEWKNTNLYCEVCVPFQFSIWKNDYSRRKLDLLHPLSQLQMFKFVDDNDHELTDYCNSNSIFSIRYPSGVNTVDRKYGDKIQREMNFILEENKEYQNNEFEYFVDSYFEKKKFKKITQFYSSHLFKKLETKFSLLLRIDVKNCFDSIYTHSIDWAYLGDKTLAKESKNITNRFSSQLDKLMQSANYGETNGLVVGPEFSRLVAEIVLMRIDYYVYKELQEEGYRFKSDYEIIRYIDDIFIFSNDSALNKRILLLYEKYTKYYKLDLNESKTLIERRPFLRKNTWVRRMREIMGNHFSDFQDILNQFNTLDCQPHSKKLLKSRTINLIEDVRSIIIDHESEREKIISYFFNAYERQFKKLFALMDGIEIKDISYFLFGIIDVLHYALVFSITTPHINKFIYLMTKLTSFAEKNKMLDVINLIYKKGYEILKYNPDYIIETLNLVIFMRRLKKDLPEELLLKRLKKDANYFSLSVVMHYLTGHGRGYRYKRTRDLINNIIDSLVDEVEEKYFGKEFNSKLAKRFLFSEFLYPIHDYYSYRLLNPKVKKKIEKIRTKLVGTNFGKEDVFFNALWSYIKDFDKPFMRFDANDNDLVPLIILKASKEFDTKISG